MIAEKIVFQSAGSFSVAMLALLMMILEVKFYFRKPRLILYAWSAAVSFSAMLYAVGIFFEYNAPPGLINRSAGLLEYTAIICLIHCLYGFTFSYFGINGKYYHITAGTFHAIVLILIWFTNLVVADQFVTRHFLALAQPFVEAALGPLGPYFVLYASLASMGGIIIWIGYKDANHRNKVPYLAGIIFWTNLGVHDGIASLGVPTYQYLMEYGFIGFSIVVLWVVFSKFNEISVKDKYLAITEFANDSILVIQNGKVVFENPACSTLAGRSVIDLAIKDLLKLIVPENRNKISQYCKKLTYDMRASDSITVCLKKVDGAEKSVEIKTSVIDYLHKSAHLSVIRDVSERVRKEKALRESEEKISRLRKMESLGLLAGGVAHDLNNVLAGIVGYPDLILMELPEDSKFRKAIVAMQESGLRAAAIVQDLLTVARGVAIEKRAMNLNRVIESYFKSPEYEKLLYYHPLITVKADLDSQLLPIKGSSVHINKVVMNLVSNAAEAIKSGGHVVVSTENRYLDQPLHGYNDVKKGEYVVLLVSDDGSGISSDDLKQIFEPFYTKKVMGRSGTGLGLTLVWNVVQDHGGYIDVVCDSHGTRFELYFPITREAVVAEFPPIPLEHLFGRGEMILVVDDVESQRELSCDMLKQLGYKTESVTGGKEAIEYVKEHSVDLLLLDMIMDPGMNGLETYEEIKKIHPKQKAIIVSGFSETDQVKGALKLGAGRYIKKPLILEALGRAVKEELNTER